MKRETLKNTAYLLALAVVLAFGLSGCAKKRGGETADEFKARKLAVYSAQSFTSLDGWSDAVEIIQRGGKITLPTARAIYEVNERVRRITQQVAESIQAGKPQDAIGYIERGIVEIEKAEQSGIFQITDPVAADRFYNIIVGVKLGLTSIRAVIAATKEPSTSSVRGLLAQRQEPPNARWWTELIALGERVALKLWTQSRLDTAQAWEDALFISSALASKNAARLTS